jgi:DNA polymerase III subunit alpha
MSGFAHLHVHTQYSILDGASDIRKLVNRTTELGMKALAITDHGNMFGVKLFHSVATAAGIKPIIGCEMYVARRSAKETSEKEDRSGNHLILLAKNLKGYHNLMKLVSAGYTEGFYYKPRIDKEMLRRYSEGLIATSACIASEIAVGVLNDNMEEAGNALKSYKEIFGDDFYLEIQRHQTNDPTADRSIYPLQERVIKGYRKLAEENSVKLIASNDVHFIKEEDADAHDVLICINTNSDFDDPSRLRYSKQEYLKSEEEMRTIFSDIPEAVDIVSEIVDKVENYRLDHDPVMPEFKIPEEFSEPNEYLRHLTFEGAINRWGEVTPELRQRLDFELDTIASMGFPDYFLIVQDFLRAARKMDVSVGPGRGSAAGSAVAYCLRITDIDPVKYGLLFERFLNPDRISMPDIDIDFDEDGRDQVLKYVVDKYGHDKVAHIITFGSMASKMAIRDVARVQKLPLSDADRLAKMVPERPKITLQEAYKESPELAREREHGEGIIPKILNFAETLEGSIRQTGVHACGIIISRDKLDEHIPICTAKETELYATQYDGSHVESVGLLKMDFLGLKTLSIIRDAVKNIKKSCGEEIDISNIPPDDTKTFELFSRGETTALFQFESAGMKRYLRELKPNRFEDLIAMNALYRPGPMEYIPKYIKRKHGIEPISYELPVMEELLNDTYGITVYQEQVMLLSQKLAGFTKGEADSLRKAMGKKIRTLMDQMKVKFKEGCEKNGHSPVIADKIWTDWEAFAEYAFNKSHSTCYALIAYQTGYLKANYPAEYMAAVLSRNLNDIKKITIFMDETRRMGIEVLGPHINESDFLFTVNKDGNIRFGLGAIKGVGANAVEQLLEERKNNGHFNTIHELVERANLNSLNKKALEAMAVAGVFDCFPNINRAQYFAPDSKGSTFIENLIRYGNNVKTLKNTTQQSLFGESDGFTVVTPEPPASDDWGKLEKLNSEKEVIGIYLSAHPLDDYKLEINSFCNATLSELQELAAFKGRDVTVAGMVTEARNGISKKGNPYGIFVLQDYTDSYRFMLFDKDYVEHSKYLQTGYFLLIKGAINKKRFNDELEYSIKKIYLLQSVREELVQSFTIRVMTNMLTSETVEVLNKATAENNGKTELRFQLVSPSDKIILNMFSRTRRVKVTNELLALLDEIPAINYRVN